MTETETKQCRTCLAMKPASQFYKKGWHVCKTCISQKRKANYEKLKQAYCETVKEKTCVVCKRTKPIDQFGFFYTSKDGHKQRCHWCEREAKERRTQSDPIEREKLRTLHRRSRYKTKYGITLEEYDALLAEQSGVCAICGKPETQKRQYYQKTELRDLAVDHCHKTKKVRALLCCFCNQGIGIFREDTELLKKAIAYLEKHSAT